jgi:hypothetical protein
MDFAPNEFGLQGPSANGRPAPTGKGLFASAKADAWRGAPWEADFNRRESLQPMVGLGCRMNSASRGLRPMVGLRRPQKCLLRWRRPAPGVERPWRPISIGVGAFGRRSACTPNEFGLQRPSASGRPAPTEKMPSALAEAGAWRGAPVEADFNRRESLRRPKKCLLCRQRPTPGAERPWRPISIGVGAFGRWSACTPNEFGLQRPSANGRPAPTGKGLFASAEADAWRVSAPEGRFQSARRPMPGAKRLRRSNSFDHN